MLAMISMVTGIAAGSLALIVSMKEKQPEKARQLRMFSAIPFGMALLMAIVFVF